MCQSRGSEPAPADGGRRRAPLSERARFFYVRHFYNRVIRLAPRSPDPYTTHLPSLLALGAIVRPSRVLEYGSGLISTPTFLNRKVFPALTSLVSFENHRDWYEAVASRIGDDARLQLRLVDGPMNCAVAGRDLAAADLVFVDDYHCDPPPLPGRADTIAALAALRPCGFPIIIHDLELRHIRRSAGRFQHIFRVDAFNPQTGVVWNGHWRGATLLPSINRLIKRHGSRVPGQNAEQWAALLGALAT